ncbi:restriction endonuclease subunit S [Xenorhabdus sp. 18]|uniref:restriction endonuclease subunit S n=1 Tax=Xenorhabdus doucetiae TaxID=351671 RepID=UPI0019C84C69|nr:restriction endonuclease subunit S [Xenorhabdus sp. 18]MBD2797650.1 restriction endonuclease subunit S [Xenorhabdus sp. 18]
MAKYKAYSEYKDSGVEWLGEIPDDWIVCRLKNLATIKNGQDYKSVQAENGYPVMGSGGQFTFAYKYMYDRPSVLLGRKGTIDKPLYINEPFWTVDTMYYTELNEGVDAKYLYYLTLTIQFSRYSTNTALPSMTQEHLSNYKFAVPKAESDRKQIINFLNHETAKIDNLIDKQKQLIELLKEKRQAVISHAVTKGLNPDVPMKDSGVEWLGEVPTHWIVRRLKHTSSLQSGMPKGKDLTGKNSISVPMLRVANVQDGYLDLVDVHNIDIEPNQLERYLLRDGDVLMNEGGDNDKLGRGAIWTAPINNCIHQNHVFAIRPSSIESEWLDMLTRATYAKFHFYRVAKQSTNLASISSTNIKETPLLIPPKKERDEILKFVNFQLRKIKATEEYSIKQVVLLQERRTALISAAVTGKIDVRNWVAPNTQDVEEPQEAAA